MNLFRIGIVSLVLLLAACGSTPQSNYYRLSASTSGGQGDSPAIGVGPIEIPEYLNRNSMVFSQGANQLHIAGYQRWAEPLEDGITRALGLNLAEALDTQNIRPFPWPPSDAPQYAVQLWLISLDAGPQQTRMVLEWRLRHVEERREVARRISHFEGAGANLDGAALAAICSDMLHRLSGEIAARIRSDQASNGT